MTIFTLTPRQESPTRYDRNKEINRLIQDAFQNSIKEFLETPYPVPEYSSTEDAERQWNDSKNRDISYTIHTTLGQSGCAIYAFHQGLRLERGYKSLTLPELADEVGCNNYYEPGKGTYHNLFDHFGLKRASDIHEVFDAFGILHKRVVTVLVANKLYPGTESTSGNHFINVVGTTSSGLLIDDPNRERRIFLKFEKILPAMLVAWIW